MANKKTTLRYLQIEPEKRLVNYKIITALNHILRYVISDTCCWPCASLNRCTNYPLGLEKKYIKKK